MKCFLQRIIVEMERMASRPFSVVAMEITNGNPPVTVKKEPPDFRASRRKNKASLLGFVLQKMLITIQ